MKNKMLLAVVFLVAGALGVTAASARPASAEEADKGCWYEPPNPPACDICGWSCGSGQQCCSIT